MNQAAPLLSEDLRVVHSSRIASRVVEKRAVVIVIDSNRLHTLNGTGTSLWENSDGRRVGEIVDWFARTHSLDPDRAARDVAAFLRELQQVGAIELVEA